MRFYGREESLPMSPAAPGLVVSRPMIEDRSREERALGESKETQKNESEEEGGGVA